MSNTVISIIAVREVREVVIRLIAITLLKMIVYHTIYVSKWRFTQNIDITIMVVIDTCCILSRFKQGSCQHVLIAHCMKVHVPTISRSPFNPLAHGCNVWGSRTFNTCTSSRSFPEASPCKLDQRITMGISINGGGTSKSSILMGFPCIYHYKPSMWGCRMTMETPMSLADPMASFTSSSSWCFCLSCSSDWSWSVRGTEHYL